MTEAEHLEHMFGVATGWLGWSPVDAWNSTVPEITVAISAKSEFLRMTTPGAKKSDSKPKESSMASFISAIVKRKETKVYGE